MRRLPLVVLLALSASGAAALGSATNGTTTADFLNLSVGARAVAMGGAYTAVVDDAGALYWNPAGLSGISHRSVTLMHAAYIGASSFDYAAYAQNFGKYGALGAGLQYFSAGSIPQTDTTGAKIGTFSPYDLAFSVGYAYKADDSAFRAAEGFSIGATGKFIESHLAATAKTEALDLGIKSPAYFGERLRLALAVLNMGKPMKFDQARENLPMAARLGLSYKIMPAWLASADLSVPRGGVIYGGIGTEYALFQDSAWTFSARAGFNTQTFQAVDGLTGPSFGFGIAYRGGSVDYGFVPLGGLGQAHRVSLNYSF